MTSCPRTLFPALSSGGEKTPRPPLPGDTVICRCEARTVNDLRALGPEPTDRQLRLDGRFSMGPCQGQLCAEWTARLAAPDTPKPRLGAPRWPARPIAIADLLAAPDETQGDPA